MHDLLELFGIGEDHGSVFVEIILEVGLTVDIHESFLIIVGAAFEEDIVGLF